MAQLMHDDEQVEKKNDLQKRDGAEKRRGKTPEDADRHDDQQEEDDESQKTETEKSGAFLKITETGWGRSGALFHGKTKGNYSPRRRPAVLKK
jgi:hypothetical protein